MKILISFLAFNNDFLSGANVNVDENGPTYLYHKFFYQYDKHILLSAMKSDDIRMDFLINKLKNDFQDHIVEGKYLDISDVIDLKEIRSKLESLLLSYKDDEIDIFFSPGTSIMQLSWYILHQSLGLKTRLIQTKRAKHSKFNKPEQIEITAEQSAVPYSSVIKQQDLNVRADDYLLTESITSIYDLATKIADVDDTTTLILGDSGTGKEHLASFIHKNSPRKDKPFITINCSAFSDQLLESRLFGYKKGSFTGADNDTIGVFKQSKGGTIFLDEIGDISSYMQQSLLRVLQQKEITPIGGKSERINVRIIAATNKNLTKLCEEDKFRWDLYYRLAVVDLELPSLLERGKEDVKKMMAFFIKSKKKKFRSKSEISLSKEAKDIIWSYHFPGNIRELENLIERLYVLHSGKEIIAGDLPKSILSKRGESPLLLSEVEKEHILKVLKLHKGNQRQTALSLGIALNTLKAKLRKSNN